MAAFLILVHASGVANEAETCESARQRMLESDYASAYQLLSALGTATKSNGCLFNFGIAALYSGHQVKGIDILRDYLRRVPQDAEAAFYFAEALERKCNSFAADEREICLRQPETTRLLTVALQDNHGVTTVCRSARGGVFARLVHILVSPEAALALYEQYTRAFPDDLRGLVSYGDALYDARHTSRALEVLVDASRRDPAMVDDSLYFQRLVLTLTRLKRYKQLLDFYDSNPARFARWPWALYNVAIAYLGVRDVNAAAKTLDMHLRLVEIDRSVVRSVSHSYSLRGDVALLQKDRETARLAYEKAIAADDDADAVKHAQRSIRRLSSSPSTALPPASSTVRAQVSP